MTALMHTSTSCQTGEQAIIVVPKDYTGYVLIIYGQENGMPEKYQDRARVYEIPGTGILETQFSYNPGWSDFPKFYYGSIAPENEIPFTADFESVPQFETIVFGGSTGFISRDIEGKEGIRYIQYFVGDKTQIRKSIEEVGNLDIASLVEP